MRRVSLKVVDVVDVVGRNTPLAYIDVIEQLAKTSDNGMTAAEMAIPLAITAALQAARDANAKYVMLEEAEYAHVVARAKVNRWPFASAAFVDLVAEIEGAVKVDPNSPVLAEVALPERRVPRAE